MIDQFLTYLEVDRSRSPNTIARYRAVLTRFSATADPATATWEDAEAWWASRFHLAPASRSNELAAMRSFYAWMIKKRHRADDPTGPLDAPKVPIRLPKPIGKADLERLLGPLTAETPDLRRAAALCAYAGLRISEAAALGWPSIDVETRRAYVIGKGDKERLVALSPVLVDILLPIVEGGNVVTGKTKGLSGGTLRRRLARLMEANGIDHTTHDLRKRGATLALAKGLNPVAVQAMFGWESLETVRHYAAVGNDELDDVAAAMV